MDNQANRIQQSIDAYVAFGEDGHKLESMPTQKDQLIGACYVFGSLCDTDGLVGTIENDYFTQTHLAEDALYAFAQLGLVEASESVTEGIEKFKYIQDLRDTISDSEDQSSQEAEQEIEELWEGLDDGWNSLKVTEALARKLAEG